MSADKTANIDIKEVACRSAICKSAEAVRSLSVSHAKFMNLSSALQYNNIAESTIE